MSSAWHPSKSDFVPGALFGLDQIYKKYHKSWDYCGEWILVLRTDRHHVKCSILSFGNMEAVVEHEISIDWIIQRYIYPELAIKQIFASL